MNQRICLMALCAACVIALPACKAEPKFADGNVANTATTATTAAANAIPAELAAHQAILIDVRTPEEYAAGHAAQAILAPYDTIEQKIASIAPDKKQKIYLYCRSGRRSTIAAETLKNLGYTNIVNLGGLNQLGQYGLQLAP